MYIYYVYIICTICTICIIYIYTICTYIDIYSYTQCISICDIIYNTHYIMHSSCYVCRNKKQSGFDLKKVGLTVSIEHWLSNHIRLSFNTRDFADVCSNTGYTHIPLFKGNIFGSFADLFKQQILG